MQNFVLHRSKTLASLFSSWKPRLPTILTIWGITVFATKYILLECRRKAIPSHILHVKKHISRISCLFQVNFDNENVLPNGSYVVRIQRLCRTVNSLVQKGHVPPGKTSLFSAFFILVIQLRLKCVNSVRLLCCEVLLAKKMENLAIAWVHHHQKLIHC